MQVSGARKLHAVTNNSQGTKPMSRSPTVTVREEQKVKNIADQLMLKNQPNSSTQVYGAVGSNKPSREGSAELADFSRS